MKLSKPTNSYMIFKRFHLKIFIIALFSISLFAEDNVSNVLFDDTSKNLEKGNL